MSKSKRFIFLTVSAVSISLSLMLLWVSNNYVVPIMMYHHVDYVEKPQADTVSPELFEEHMAFLKNKNYHVLSLDDLVNAIEGNRKISRNSVVITFDDGYDNNYTYAYNILKKYNFPAIIFASSSFVDEEGFLTQENLREMVENGIEIGSHTRTHQYLPELNASEQKLEVFESKVALERMTGKPVKYFAYPVGGFSDEIKDIVKKAGYYGALSTNRGYDKKNNDVFELNRIRFSDKDNRNYILAMKLSGYYNLMRGKKAPY